MLCEDKYNDLVIYEFMNTKTGSPCDFKSDLPEEDEKSPKEDKNIKYNRQNSPLYKQAAFILDQVRGKVKKHYQSLQTQPFS